MKMTHSYFTRPGRREEIKARANFYNWHIFCWFSGKSDKMSKCVLLVEDDDSTRLVVTAILTMHGYQVIALSDCYDIVENVEKYDPSLVLMDIWLPGPGGEYAAKALKNNPRTSEIPVVMFSGEEDIMNTTTRVGAEGAIIKPFDMVQFASTVAQYIH